MPRSRPVSRGGGAGMGQQCGNAPPLMPGSVREKARRQMPAGQFFEFDLGLVLPARPEPVEKMGLGSSPRSLSPNTDIWRPASPVECRWLSVSRRCAGLLRTIAFRFGSAAEPAGGITTSLSGETSQPGALHALQARIHRTRFKMLLRRVHPSPLPQGRHLQQAVNS